MTPLLNIAGVRRKYGNLQAVAGVDLGINAGDRHAVIGCNGAGKSTLLHLIAGTVRPSAGRIEFDGRNMTRKSPASRCRRGIARTFQTPAVIDTLTVAENVYLAARPSLARLNRRDRKREMRLRAAEQLDALGLIDHADTVVGALSHGQRRLLELGTVLVSRPRLLLLDEPAAGLTDTDLSRVLACLKALPADLALLLVEHNQDMVAAVAEKVTVMHEGEILAQDTPHQIASNTEVARVYLGADATAKLKTGGSRE